jgi:hypothetical protein
MNRELFDPPGIVRTADSLAELASAINAAHFAGETACRKGLEHFKKAGEALLKAKEQCGHGKFKAWVEENIQTSYRTAANYMRVAREWDKCATAAHLRDALRLLTEDDQDEERALAYQLLDMAKRQNEWLNFVRPFAWILESEDGRTVKGFVFTDRGMFTLDAPSIEHWKEAGRLIKGIQDAGDYFTSEGGEESPKLEEVVHKAFAMLQSAMSRKEAPAP